ncbi:phosphopantetheine-binding protein [Streptomyces sp. NPDC098077]|uniref:phosphopantetheine-binding protein n=1 Tax=Streptomyces sp. NPDC098077 TaxID=3366093 RepID=UPI0038204654
MVEVTEDMSGAERGAPHTPTQIMVAEIWEKVLDQGPFTLTDDFFEVGGHSLLATQVVSLIRRETGRRVPLRLLIEGPTLEEFANAVEVHFTSPSPS